MGRFWVRAEIETAFANSVLISQTPRRAARVNPVGHFDKVDTRRAAPTSSAQLLHGNAIQVKPLGTARGELARLLL
jgi:hypothetical protein